VAANRVQVDPDVGIPDLVKQLGEDSKRLVRDEVTLAKLELHESVRRAGKGAMWMGIAFGVGVVMLVALTLFLTTAIGAAVNHHYWAGAVVTGMVELAVAALLIKRGMSQLRAPSYSLEETRAEARNTARWIARPR
jgi:uncharacterized membrane protein YqjE